jgi:hypothetical protein
MMLPLVACAHALPEEQPCLEVATALGSRTEECTGDRALALQRLSAFEEAYACELPQDLPPEYVSGLYECALIVRNLACELALEYGDDLEAWLDSSPTCAMILVPR